MDEPEPKSQESENLVAEGLHAQRRQYSSHFFSHGDTLASVAMRHKMELSDLMKINRLNKWSHVRTGQILYVRASPSLERAQQQREDTETKGDGATDIMVDSSERRSNSLDERRPAPSRAPFGRGTLLDLSKSADIVEPELLLHAKREQSSMMGRSLSYSSGSSSSKDATSQRDRLLLEATQANLDVYRDERVKYCQGTDHVLGILVVTSWRFIFQPSPSDLAVQKKGFLHYQLNISIRDIYDCCEETELATAQCLSSDTYVQVCVKQKVKQGHKKSEGKVVNGKILYFQVSRQRSQALVQKLSAAMEKHKAGNALSHNRRQKAGASLPRRSMMLPAESAGSAADPVLHEGPSSLLLIDDIRAIQNMLPARERSCDWKLVYSSDKHGVSLNTFYTRARNKGPTVMIVEDSMHHIFGAFCSESWQVSDKYYGTGNSFLYMLYPKKAFYLWTGANNFVQLSGEDFLSVGGGSGTMGLWLNDDFSGGSSQTCDTFANAPLASTEEFSVLSVEVWGFVASE